MYFLHFHFILPKGNYVEFIVYCNCINVFYLCCVYVLSYGLLLAMDALLSGLEQRFCVQNLYNKFRKKYPEKVLKKIIWKVAKSIYSHAWEREMKEMRVVNEDAYKHMMKNQSKFWSKLQFRTNTKRDSLLNNMSKHLIV